MHLRVFEVAYCSFQMYSYCSPLHFGTKAIKYFFLDLTDVILSLIRLKKKN